MHVHATVPCSIWSFFLRQMNQTISDIMERIFAQYRRTVTERDSLIPKYEYMSDGRKITVKTELLKHNRVASYKVKESVVAITAAALFEVKE